MPHNTGTNPLSDAPVYSNFDVRTYTGQSGDYMDVGHHAALALSSGTISLSFSLARLPGNRRCLPRTGLAMRMAGT